MPFVLLVIGLTLLFAAINGTQSNLFQLVQGDFSGPGSFIYWLFAIAIVGGVGYIPQMKGISHAFLALLLVVLLLHSSKNNPQGFFGSISNALAASAAAPPAKAANSNSSSGSNALGPIPALPPLKTLTDAFDWLTGGSAGQ